MTMVCLMFDCDAVSLWISSFRQTSATVTAGRSAVVRRRWTCLGLGHRQHARLALPL